MSVVFAMVAVGAVIKGRADPLVAWYPAGAAFSVAACLGTVWAMSHLTSRPLDPVFAVVGYEVVLLGIALLFPVGARVAVRVRDRLADRLLSDAGGEGVEGLVSVLQRTLGDPALRVYRDAGGGAPAASSWRDNPGCYADDSGIIAAHPAPGWMTVDSGSQPVAGVVTRTAALDDPATAAAVSSAVLLAVTNIRLREDQRGRLRELEVLEPRYARRLLADQPGGLGYLLKERVSDIAVLVDALARVAASECVIDPTIVSRLMRRRRLTLLRS